MNVVRLLAFNRQENTIRPLVLYLGLTFIIALVFLFIVEIACLILGAHGLSIPVTVIEFVLTVKQKAVEIINGLK